MATVTRDPGIRSLGLHILAVSSLLVVVARLYRGTISDRVLASQESPEVYLRVLGYMQEFAAGHWPPQVLPDAYGGGGSAFPRFYPPVAYWISSATSAITGDPVTGVNASFALSVLLSAFTFYLMAWRLTGSILPSVLGAMLYCVAPFRFVDVFLRGALAESWTFVWYPLIALGINRVTRDGSIPWYLPVSIALLLLTHTVMALYAISLACVYVVVLGLLAPRRLSSYIRHAVVVLMLGAGLSAWHLLPAKLSWGDIRASVDGLMWNRPEQVADRAISLRTMLGGFIPAELPTTFARRGDSAFVIGAADLVLLPLTFVLIALVFFRRKSREPPGAGLDRIGMFGVVGIWLIAVTFVVKPRPALDVLPSAYGMVQFPWRLLGPATFLSATALILFLCRLRTYFPIGARGAWRCMILAGAILAALFPVQSRHKTAHYRKVTAATLQEVGADSARRGYTILGEYAPRTLFRSSDAVLEAAERAPRTRGIVAIQRNGSVTNVHVDSVVPLHVELPIVDYDFYDARIEDGRVAQMYSSQGLVGLKLGPGKYAVTVRPYLNRTACLGITISGVAVLAIIAMQFRRRQNAMIGLQRVQAT